jgi:dephospho-CoA kinase
MRELRASTDPMILLGLTGGVGMGKSTGAALLAQRNVPVIDTDVLARELVEPGQTALAEIARCFGPQILGPDQRLNRGELARLVFSSPAARQQLEAILHPRIRAAWLAQASLWRAQGQPIGAVVIPLLFETAAEAQFDAIICVACSAATQQARLLLRGWSEDEATQRIQAQWPIEKKMRSAGFVIWTEGSLTIHQRQLERVLAELTFIPVRRT